MSLCFLLVLLVFVVCSDALVHAVFLVLAVVAMVPLYIGLQLITRFHFSDFNFNFIKKNLFYKIEIKMVLIKISVVLQVNIIYFFYYSIYIYNLILQNDDIHKLWILFRK